MKLTYILNKNKDGLIVTGGEDLKGELIIPFEDELNGKVYPVKEIGASLGNTIDSIIWDRPPLTSVFIPNSVTKIGNDAFSDCTELSSLDIPKSIIEIGRSAFRSCRSLSSIVILIL